VQRLSGKSCCAPKRRERAQGNNNLAVTGVDCIDLWPLDLRRKSNASHKALEARIGT
jgi:hypothetical protein